MLVLVLPALSFAQTLDALTVTVAPAKAAYVVGEPLWIDVTFHNAGPDSVELALYESARTRAEGLVMEATDAQGRVAPDAWHQPRQGGWAGNRSSVSIPGGGSATVPLDLARFAWLDDAGTWDVRVRYPAQSQEVATTRIELAAATPETAARIVASLPAWVDLSGERAGPAAYYESLGHSLYVPLLEPLAAQDLAGAEPGFAFTARAVAGLGACPCPEATEALMRVYDQTESPLRRAIVADELLRRGPTPVPSVERTQWFTDHAWDPRLAGPLRVLARRALEVPTDRPGWYEDYAFGADILRQVGGPDDLPTLIGALAAALSDDPPPRGHENARASVIEAIVWTLGGFRPEDLAEVPADPITRLAVDLAVLDERGGVAPPDAETRVVRALSSGRTRLVALALDRAPATPGVGLAIAVVPHLGSPDPYVAQRAERVLMHSRSPEVDQGLVDRLGTASGEESTSLLSLLKARLPGDEWADVVLRKAATEPDHVQMLTSLLAGCVESTQSGPAEEQLHAMTAAWTVFLAAERARLHAGPVPIEPGVTPTALVWDGWSCTLASGTVWP